MLLMQTHSPSNFAFDMSQTDDFFIVLFVDSIFSYCFATSTLSTVRFVSLVFSFFFTWFVYIFFHLNQRHCAFEEHSTVHREQKKSQSKYSPTEQRRK